MLLRWPEVLVNGAVATEDDLTQCEGWTQRPRGVPELVLTARAASGAFTAAPSSSQRATSGPHPSRMSGTTPDTGGWNTPQLTGQVRTCALAGWKPEAL
jgi:hypothetical protein